MGFNRSASVCACSPALAEEILEGNCPDIRELGVEIPLVNIVFVTENAAHRLEYALISPVCCPEDLKFDVFFRDDINFEFTRSNILSNI